MPTLVYVEDFQSKVSWQDKLIAAVATWLIPVAWLSRWFALDQHPARRLADGHLHLRHHGQTEGSDADPPQRRLERRRDRRGP